MTSTVTEFHTRDAQPDERDAIIALTLAAYAQYETVIPPQAWHDYVASIRHTFMTDTASTRIIATQDTMIIGSALLIPPAEPAGLGRVAQPYPEIRLIAVAPAARCRGVASALLDACISRARAAGHDAIGLHSTHYMADAIRLYLRIGFLRSPEHDVITPSGVQVLGFRLSLAHLAPHGA